MPRGKSPLSLARFESLEQRPTLGGRNDGCVWQPTATPYNADLCCIRCQSALPWGGSGAVRCTTERGGDCGVRGLYVAVIRFHSEM